MNVSLIRRQPRLLVTLVALALMFAVAFVSLDAPSEARDSSAAASKGGKATVVLVHGAFADASGWDDVQNQLKDKGYQVYAWANPLRGVTSDGAYLRSFLETIPGPIILVGHSYGGAVIGEASTGNANVKSLVYVAAFALAKGENVSAANELGGGHSDIIENITVRPYPGAPQGDGDATIRPSSFRAVFAQDLPYRITRTLATSQRPATLSSLVIPAGEPGYTTIPSYFLVAKNDRVIPPEAQRVMAKRAGARTRVVESSHALLMTHPKKVTSYILLADKQH
jgi:pimeloyl-ACP methyl ester carboxylesterase